MNQIISKNLKYNILSNNSIKLPLTYEVETINKELIEGNPYDDIGDGICDRYDRYECFLKQQRRTLLNKRKFLISYEKYGGNITITCKVIGIKSRKTIYNWIEKDKYFAEAMEDITSIKGDFYEDLLLAFAYKGNISALRFFLSHNHPKYMTHRKYYKPSEKKTYGDLCDLNSIV
ncbi:MAG: hypothetical protein KAJ58_00795 [Candidatus Pacebacteria bacterium]|nr:hypothetical protein [Candidatus Paceibacterota bacterium]